ncbi:MULTISPECIES: helix-turn-helix domain-containing protein [unclassified Leptolyngbya]|uniref:helix-turn-helix domain-containing protein n=1 Tax=unclassified Leptolyngbya TaxID=2650499 RepID=UPI001682E9BB|nr:MULTISPECIES: helix-turn-helix domain-containing protein [unclassified Leptolyngbya]MBD1909420.1 hypothetical protein [Leptolyngbya sp. FACHB-8]MBD2157593.1 hypothetical protein [Leptolyngbya sp. FACHB-16]
MNKTSTDKIKLATPFLIWFRRCLPQTLQTQIRPYLDRPYQLALNILDCCDSSQPRTVREIAQLSGVAQETARQVLQTLKEGGMTFAASPTYGWQARLETDADLTALASFQVQLTAQEDTSEPAMTTQGL